MKTGATSNANKAKIAKGPLVLHVDQASRSRFQAYTPEDLTQLFQVGKRTVSKWMEDRKIGFIKIGRSARFLPEHLGKFTARYQVKPDSKFFHTELRDPVLPPTKFF